MIKGKRSWSCGGIDTGLLPWTDISNNTPPGSGVGGGGVNGPGAPPESGNLLTHSWGALVATNNGVMYGAPTQADYPLKMVFSGGNLVGIGMFGDPLASAYGFSGACRASNGKVFFLGANKGMAIDPATDVVALFDVWTGNSTPPMFVSPTGNPAFVLNDGGLHIVEIDRVSNASTSRLITGNTGGAGAFTDVIMHPDGNVYLLTDVGIVKVDFATAVASYDFPFAYPLLGRAALAANGAIMIALNGGASNVPSNRIARYNPAGPVHPTLGIVWPDEVSFVFDSGTSSNVYFYNAVLHPNGNVFALGANANGILNCKMVEVNPATLAYHLYDTGVNSTNAGWGGATIGHDGRLYAAPKNRSGVFYMNNNVPLPVPNWNINPYLNRN